MNTNLELCIVSDNFIISVLTENNKLINKVIKCFAYYLIYKSLLCIYFYRQEYNPNWTFIS